MVNLRYHVVSLVAVFLALGIGIVMGSTVVSRGTVDALRAQLHRVERRDDNVDRDNSQLRGQLRDQTSLWARFSDQAAGQLLRGRLSGVPVVIVATRGIDGAPIAALRKELVAAGATFNGTVWITRKLRVDNVGDTRALGLALGVPVEQADALRNIAIERIADTLDGVGRPSDSLGPLRSAGFIDYDATDVGTPPTTQAPDNLVLPASRVVVASGAGAQVADQQAALPLVREVASTAGTVAVEAGRDTPGGREVFVGALRAPNGADAVAHLVTVDDLDSFIGDVATVLALEQLPALKVLHLGVGHSAQHLLPPASPASQP